MKKNDFPWTDVKGDYPVSPYFKYHIVDDKIHILLENLRARYTDKNGKEKKNDAHLKKAKNVIYWAIILYKKYRDHNCPEKLTTIILHYKNNDTLRHETLPLILNQSKYLSIEVESDSYSTEDGEAFEFKQQWAESIADYPEARVNELSSLLPTLIGPLAKKIQLYKTITSPEIQIRYMGYQIGKYLKGDQVIPVNNKNHQTFPKWARVLISGRSDRNGAYYNDETEHYAESIMLGRQFDGTLNINGLKVSKLFSRSELAFQYPALMYGTQRRRGNSPKYIDIMGKHGKRPVLMELKICGGGNSRGQYLFEAFSQLLCYYHYYSELKKGEGENFKQLEELYSLHWENPILLVVVNDIGIDKRAGVLLDYISTIKSYFIPSIEIHFAEFDNVDWGNRKVNFIEERC